MQNLKGCYSHKDGCSWCKGYSARIKDDWWEDRVVFEKTMMEVMDEIDIPTPPEAS